MEVPKGRVIEHTITREEQERRANITKQTALKE